MLCRKRKIAVYSDNHTEHMNTLCGRHAKFLYVKPGGIERNNWALTGIIIGYGKAVSVLHELYVIEAYGKDYRYSSTVF